MKARKPPSLLRKGNPSYTTPSCAYASNSYRPNGVDKEFMHNLFTHGSALYIAPTDMKARYYAMRIRCILFKEDQDFMVLCKFGLRGNEVIGWITTVHPLMQVTDSIIRKTRDMGWITYHNTLSKKGQIDAEACLLRMRKKVEGVRDDFVIENEDALKESILKAIEGDNEIE